MPHDTPQLNVWLDETLTEFLDARSDGQTAGGRGKRGGRSLAAYEALDAYRGLLVRAVANVSLSEQECLALADLLNGTILFARMTDGATLAAEVADADPAQLARWDINPAALEQRLDALTPTEAWAVYDAIKAAWRRDEPDFADRLRAVGLIR